ncbi:hypothetical protein CMI37_11640 [Candidatus Pacearchaeota archaeon]|nr:hypothetical protein [Candidatus Pacearchaeota archaeon]|tara:strand:+ start:666 stop:872 length:207 start_codon:yes stop_codon:yes gene_type:complete
MMCVINGENCEPTNKLYRIVRLLRTGILEVENKDFVISGKLGFELLQNHGLPIQITEKIVNQMIDGKI